MYLALYLRSDFAPLVHTSNDVPVRVKKFSAVAMESAAEMLAVSAGLVRAPLLHLAWAGAPSVPAHSGLQQKQQPTDCDGLSVCLPQVLPYLLSPFSLLLYHLPPVSATSLLSAAADEPTSECSGPSSVQPAPLCPCSRTRWSPEPCAAFSSEERVQMVAAGGKQEG